MWTFSQGLAAVAGIGMCILLSGCGDGLGYGTGPANYVISVAPSNSTIGIWNGPR